MAPKLNTCGKVRGIAVPPWPERVSRGPIWPFVWGFIFFALFAFFVELVPYLPSYGGYVRYVVGIIVTVLVGRQAIVSLNRYLEKQKLAEQLPDVQRKSAFAKFCHACGASATNKIAV